MVGAGMPPALVYQASMNRTITVPLKGMPLGGPGDFSYEEQSIMLSPGDTVLLMSDGFPELFNAAGEMLGYDRTIEIFEEVADRSPDNIIAHMTSVMLSGTGVKRRHCVTVSSALYSD